MTVAGGHARGAGAERDRHRLNGRGPARPSLARGAESGIATAYSKGRPTRPVPIDENRWNPGTTVAVR